MAYFWYDEDEEYPEGRESVDVVGRSVYDEVVTERDGLYVQRDELIERAETAEAGWREAQNKYADAFITSRDRMKRDQEDDVRKDGSIQTFEELWGYRGEYGAY